MRSGSMAAAGASLVDPLGTGTNGEAIAYSFLGFTRYGFAAGPDDPLLKGALRANGSLSMLTILGLPFYRHMEEAREDHVTERESQGFFDDPYPSLHEQRCSGALVPDGSTGALLCTRYQDVRAVIRDRDLSKDPRKLSPHGHKGQPIMLFLDPPEHTRLRALVQKAFTPARVGLLRPRVEAITAELLDAASDRPVIDVMAALARPLPIRVIGELLGVDVSAVPEFAEWCDAMSSEFNPAAPPEVVRRATEAKHAFNECIRATVAVRRNAPCDDLVTALLEVEQAGDRLTESELVSLCRLLLLAGNITTTEMLGNGVLALLDHSEQQALLRRDPSLLPRAVDEMLRHNTSVTGVGRNVVDHPVVVAGQTLQWARGCTCRWRRPTATPCLHRTRSLRHQPRREHAPVVRRGHSLLSRRIAGMARAAGCYRRAFGALPAHAARRAAGRPGVAAHRLFPWPQTFANRRRPGSF